MVKRAHFPKDRGQKTIVRGQKLQFFKSYGVKNAFKQKLNLNWLINNIPISINSPIQLKNKML